MTIARGVQAGFGECLGPGPYDLIESWALEVVRIGVEPGKHEPADIVAELAGRSLTPIICVHLALDVGPTVDAAQMQLPFYYLELGNEPSIHGLHPGDYAEYAERQIQQALERGLPRTRIAYGAIVNCDGETLRWLEPVSTRLDRLDPDRELLVSFHRYAIIRSGRQWPTIPHHWHTSRDVEHAALLEAAHGRALICSEFGFDSGTRVWNGHELSMTLERQAEDCRRELARMDRDGVQVAVWYQLNDGPTNSFIDRYGLRTASGEVKQPLVDALAGAPEQREASA